MATAPAAAARTMNDIDDLMSIPPSRAGGGARHLACQLTVKAFQALAELVRSRPPDDLGLVRLEELDHRITGPRVAQEHQRRAVARQRLLQLVEVEELPLGIAPRRAGRQRSAHGPEHLTEGA